MRDLATVMTRVRRLLALTKSDSPAEAALAAERAAELMREYRLTEAEIALTEARVAEVIIKGHIVTESRRRCAWRGTVANAVIKSYGGSMYWWAGGIRFFGRESAVQAATYTSQYLWREIERLCDETWAREGDRARECGQSAKGWRNAFRIGAASVIACRLRDKTDAERATRQAEVQAARAARAADCRVAEATARIDALAVIEREDREVESAYADYKKRNGFRALPSIGTTRSRDGYSAGREAGGRIPMGGGRAGLGAGQGRLRGHG